MALTRRILYLSALLFGVLGLIGCLVALVGVWRVGATLTQTAENVFEQIDAGLLVAGDRVAKTRDRVEAAKITTRDLEQGLKDWTKRETGERLAERFELAEKTERLASGLEQADRWLEVSQSSVELVGQAMSLGSSAGMPVDATSVDGLIEEIGSLRSQLAEATDFVAKLHERTTDEQSPGDRIEQAVQLALRVIATLGTIDSHLEEFGNHISQTRNDLQDVKDKTLRWILAGKLAAVLLIIWMAAGQIALGMVGYRGLRCAKVPTDRARE